ncbi:ABC transporter ATP-binding protein [Methylomagnum ishizawai]|uniref:ABC transporter ATP-binding protein n=1 Tax=Methylomagnum ishizawai TaxID=1760988 RepID=UPI001FE5A69A|nr:ATP-binding cassette domain-containing protein [Methylomagnum ishizawai]
MNQVWTRFGAQVVHSGIDLEVRRAEIFAVIGGSGSGKSTLLREMILLQRPDSGSIRVLGVDLKDIDDDGALALRRRWGVMFQHGGLFGSLTVRENVGLPLREHTGLADGLIDEIAAWKLAMTGLAPKVGGQYPSELSGGMLIGVLRRGRAGRGGREVSGQILSRIAGMPQEEAQHGIRGVRSLGVGIRAGRAPA